MLKLTWGYTTLYYYHNNIIYYDIFEYNYKDFIKKDVLVEKYNTNENQHFKILYRFNPLFYLKIQFEGKRENIIKELNQKDSEELRLWILSTVGYKQYLRKYKIFNIENRIK